MKIVRLFIRLTPYFFRNHLFIHRPEECLQPPSLDPEYRIEFPCDVAHMTDDDLADIATDRKALHARQQQGDLFGIVSWRGQIVHRLLVQTRGMAVMEGDPRAFLLKRDEIYAHYGYTALNHRGKGILPAMLHRIITYSSERANPCAIFAACRRENASSARGIQRAGFRYLKSSAILGMLSGRVRIRCWYVDTRMARVLHEISGTGPTKQK